MDNKNNLNSFFIFTKRFLSYSKQSKINKVKAEEILIILPLSPQLYHFPGKMVGELGNESLVE
jgi:hypothetical protein